MKPQNILLTNIKKPPTEGFVSHHPDKCYKAQCLNRDWSRGHWTPRGSTTSSMGSPRATDCQHSKCCRGWYQGTLAFSLDIFSWCLFHGPKHEARLNFALTQGNGPNVRVSTCKVQTSPGDTGAFAFGWSTRARWWFTNKCLEDNCMRFL